MNIVQVKEKLSEKTGIKFNELNMKDQLNEDKTPTGWVSHWENDGRIRVVMHKDVLAKIVADKNFNGLALKDAEVVEATPERAAYTKFFVITPQDILATL